MRRFIDISFIFISGLITDILRYAAKWGESLVDFIIPRECAVCRRTLQRGEKHLCIFCESDIPFTRYWNIRNNPMSVRLNDLIQRDIDKSILNNNGVFPSSGYDLRNISPQHIKPVKYSYATALFFYRGGNGYRKIPQRLKYMGDISEGRFYSRILGNALKNSQLFRDIDMIVPVPLHWTRKWKRGYNQSAVIAETLAKTLGVPIFKDILRRNRRTRTQTKLSIEDKAKNVHNAFSINRRHFCLSSSNKAPAHPGHILVVDDVFTTGATVHACVTVLLEHFGPDTRISAAALGFVSGG